MPTVDEATPNRDEDRVQTDPRASYKKQNSPQETMLKLVDVTGNTLMTMSTQLQPESVKP